jgi:hypothetical protein
MPVCVAQNASWSIGRRYPVYASKTQRKRRRQPTTQFSFRGRWNAPVRMTRRVWRARRTRRTCEEIRWRLRR